MTTPVRASGADHFPRLVAGAVPDAAVRKRLVYHVGGFDRMTPDAFHRRFVRELRRFEATWCVAAQVTEATVTADTAAWHIETRGANWCVETELRLLRWDDVIAAAGERPLFARLGSGALAWWDFVFGGALWGYLRSNWRYALFFIYPMALLAVFAGAALLVALGGYAALGAAGAVAIGVGLFALLLVWPGRRLFLLHLLDDWTFSRRYIWNGDPLLEARLRRVAVELRERAEHVDEVVVVGHSLGAVLAVDLLNRALAAEEATGQACRNLVLLTIGSSILKIGLHRAAKRFRAAVERVAKGEHVFWVEYQAVADLMNFYKTNPVARLGIGAPGRPLVRVIRLRRMLDPAFYRRIRGNFFRLHNQFVSGNDVRAAYDYFMFLCGPLPAQSIARSPDGAVSAIGVDGALSPGVGGAA